MKIPLPRHSDVEHISFFAAPPFQPHDTAYDMLIYLMEQPWADIKRANGGVVVADLRGGAGAGRIVASFSYAKTRDMAGATAIPQDPDGVVLQFRPREKAPT